jgi:hypothetical protein
VIAESNLNIACTLYESLSNFMEATDLVAIKSTRLNHLGIVKERVSNEEENFGVNTCLASSTLIDKFTHFE